MDIINQSRKIIGINGSPLLPGETVSLPDGSECHPAIADYLAKGIVADAKGKTPAKAVSGISDTERAKIAADAIAQYKKQQAEAAAAGEMAAREAKEAEAKAVRSMKKPDLLAKAACMGLDVKDDDRADDLREKIIAAIGQ